MLSRPKGGWSTITIGSWSDRCSYLDDVPVILLKGFVESCITHRPAAMKFDAEGYEYIIVVDWTATHIITNKNDDFELITQNIDRDVLATKLIVDIRENIKEWAMFIADTPTQSIVDRRILELTELCNQLEESIPSDDLRQIWPPVETQALHGGIKIQVDCRSTGVESENSYTTTSTLENVTYASMVDNHTEISSDKLIRCPKCGESYYSEGVTESTAMYFQPIYKNGININPDRNTHKTHYHCMNCGHDWTISRTGDNYAL